MFSLDELTAGATSLEGDFLNFGGGGRGGGVFGDVGSCRWVGLVGERAPLFLSRIASSMLFSEYERSRSEVESMTELLMGERDPSYEERVRQNLELKRYIHHVHYIVSMLSINTSN